MLLNEKAISQFSKSLPSLLNKDELTTILLAECFLLGFKWIIDTKYSLNLDISYAEKKISFSCSPNQFYVS